MLVVQYDVLGNNIDIKLHKISSSGAKGNTIALLNVGSDSING